MMSIEWIIILLGVAALIIALCVRGNNPMKGVRYFDSDCNPLSNGKMYIYQVEGESLNLVTYSDISKTHVNPNPIIADMDGVFPPVFFDDGVCRVVLKDSNDELVFDSTAEANDEKI